MIDSLYNYNQFIEAITPKQFITAEIVMILVILVLIVVAWKKGGFRSF